MENAYEIGHRKVASLSSLIQSKDFGTAISNSMKLVGAAAVTGFAIKSILNKIQNSTRHKAIIEDLMLNDPIIKEGDKEEVLQFYAMIYNMAPKISLEKPVVRELLQNYVRVGRVDMQTLKTLAETEHKLSDMKSGVDVKKIMAV